MTSTRPAWPASTTTPTSWPGARILAPVLACDIVDTFLTSEFQGGRHQERLDEISAIEVEESRAWAAAQGPGQP